VDDLIKSMKAHLYDRVSSPLMFSFLCSWGIWNYRLIIILLSGDSPERKFAQIEVLPAKSFIAQFFTSPPSELYWLCIGFLGPLLTTLFYLLVLPKFEAMALKISLQKSVQLKEIKLDAENDTPLGQEESIQLREMVREAEEMRDSAIERQRRLLLKDLEEKQAELNEERQDAERKQQNLREQLDSTRAEVSALTQEKITLENQLRDAENLVNTVFALDQGARDMLISLSNGNVTNLKEQTRQNPKISKWFSQLYAGGLATSVNGSPRLMPLGQKLVLEHQLPRDNETGVNVAQIISG